MIVSNCVDADCKVEAAGIAMNNLQCGFEVVQG